jgi:hypothetical protein
MRERGSSGAAMCAGVARRGAAQQPAGHWALGTGCWAAAGCCWPLALLLPGSWQLAAAAVDSSVLRGLLAPGCWRCLRYAPLPATAYCI